MQFLYLLVNTELRNLRVNLVRESHRRFSWIGTNKTLSSFLDVWTILPIASMTEVVMRLEDGIYKLETIPTSSLYQSLCFVQGN